VYKCSIPNGFLDRAVSLYSSTVDKKEILRTVSDVGIYLLFKLQSWYSEQFSIVYSKSLVFWTLAIVRNFK
jgi:hypothetical protein